jgi:arylsulfatase A-like enzyme
VTASRDGFDDVISLRPAAWVRQRPLLVMALLALLAALAPAAPARADQRPNVVFVLADDLSEDLLEVMPHTRRLARDGIRFERYFVTDSLCCTSRASIFTGMYPHNTQVRTNNAPEGGYWAFGQHGGEARSVGPALRRQGYRTALMGKYINEYWPSVHAPPPGWDEWFAPGPEAYRGNNYPASANGRLRWFGDEPEDFVTDVLARRGAKFITRAAGGKRPFFLMVAPFAPHKPYAAAKRHRRLFRGLPMPRTPNFGRPPTNAPQWLERPRLSIKQERRMARIFRRRARSVQGVDEMLARLRRTLERAGVAQNTYVVFSSDNGYHVGHHALTVGKRTAFDHDVRVPLLVAGPRVPRGARAPQLAANIDLTPTFLDWAGGRPDRWRDGTSLAPLLRGRRAGGWRESLLIEHFRPAHVRADPDAQNWRAGLPPTYDALRTEDETYVKYSDGSREFYDNAFDPHQTINLHPHLDEARRQAMEEVIGALVRCRGVAQCTWPVRGGS